MSDRGNWARSAVPLLVCGLAGVALACYLLRLEGSRPVLALLSRAFWPLMADLGLHGAQLALAAAAWRGLTRTADRPGLGVFTALRWIREGVNGMLPFLPLAGPLAGMRLLARHHVPLTQSAAAIVADTRVELATQGAFAAIAVTILAVARGTGALNAWMMIGLFSLVCAIVLVLPAPWLLERFAARLLDRLRWGHGMTGIMAETLRCWRNPHRVAVACALHLAAWALGAGEVWLALRGFALHVPAWQCLVIEALGTVVRTAAVPVPAAIGVQEGGYVLICGLFGLPATEGLALSLFKRLRELAFGVSALPLWLLLERRRSLGSLIRERDGIWKTASAAHAPGRERGVQDRLT